MEKNKNSELIKERLSDAKNFMKNYLEKYNEDEKNCTYSIKIRRESVDNIKSIKKLLDFIYDNYESDLSDNCFEGEIMPTFQDYIKIYKIYRIVAKRIHIE